MLLGAFLLGGLPAHEAAGVKAHLDACPPCREERDYLACVPGWLDLLRNTGTDTDAGTPAAPGEARRPECHPGSPRPPEPSQ
jgi:Putative zinc-finger